MTLFVDTHTHFYDEAFLEDEEAAVQRAIEAGVTRMIQADVDSCERDRMFESCSKHPDNLFPMLGLYPGSVHEDWESEIEKMMQYKDRGIVAIGEIGLDYHYEAETADLQKDAFKAQMEIAAKMDLPVNIHMRDATEDFFDILESCRGLGVRGNLHAFSGSFQTFRRLEKYGDWSVGIGGVLTFKNSHLAQAVKDIPLERILLETDSPYLTPVPHRGERNESSNIPIIAAKIAEIKGLSIEEVAQATTSNAERLFNIR